LARLGTLGTGNHFMESCLDEADAVWVMLHSGSRGVGGCIGSYGLPLEGAPAEFAVDTVQSPTSDAAKVDFVER
jgi:tRNA-splicing ligase RtcB (3'-phosphate/5'-hydroxy nucleic acid ligase)